MKYRKDKAIYLYVMIATQYEHLEFSLAIWIGIEP